MSVAGASFRERSGRRRWQTRTRCSGGGGRFGYEFFLADLDGEAVRMHGQKKQCVWRWSIFLPCCTSGHHAGSTWRRLAGRAVHEAVGHGLEGDFNRRGTSVLVDRSGSWWLQNCVPWLMTADGRSPWFGGD